MGRFSTDIPWVIFSLKNEQFAVSATYVREMVALPKVVTVPLTPDYVRGLINLRGQVFSVIDLRLRLGMTSLIAEVEDLVQLLGQREQEHKGWLIELESSVKERRKFKLATDPHKCAFGMWYDNYQADNHTLSACLAKFDVPHKKIHAIAIKVKEKVENKDFDSADELINEARKGELAEMVKLFAEARSLLRESNNEIALVLELEGKTMAICVDSVKTVEKLSESNLEDKPKVISTLDNECLSGIGKRGTNNELFHLLDVDILLGLKKDLLPETSEA